jgi:DNA end-binding protein Ku
MAAHSVGTATISFGLVSIPVKLYSATQASSAVSFNLLHKKCNSRLKQQYTCPVDNEIVERSDMVKGYEVSKGQYVTFTPEELKALDEQASEAIEISEFVPAAKVDPVYYDRPYYLSPDRGGDKAYQLLSEVMRRSNKVALARYAARGKQLLVMLRPAPDNGGLVMQQLLYADEVRPQSEVPQPTTREVKEGEIALAEQLVDKVSSDAFHPENYRDDVKDRVLAQIQQKSEGHAIAAPAPAAKAQVIDLMEALKRSLAIDGGKGDASGTASAEASRARKPPRKVAPAPARKAKASK